MDRMDQSYSSGLIPGLHPANERRRYKVTPSLIGWAQTKNQLYSSVGTHYHILLIWSAPPNRSCTQKGLQIVQNSSALTK